ncbi:hypothetical protein HUJ05_009363 [Dendroctonus ponderosae]|nr:hypothetical protein HUJ05_009363 [Dendroctonus ponderosae]
MACELGAAFQTLLEIAPCYLTKRKIPLKTAGSQWHTAHNSPALSMRMNLHTSSAISLGEPSSHTVSNSSSRMTSKSFCTDSRSTYAVFRQIWMTYYWRLTGARLVDLFIKDA